MLTIKKVHDALTGFSVAIRKKSAWPIIGSTFFAILLVAIVSHTKLQLQSDITYPLESLFVPLHLVIMGIMVMTVAIFIVFMRRFLKPKKSEEDKSPFRTGIITEARDWKTDLIALASISISIVAVLFPFLQTPILDYDVSIGPNNTDSMTGKITGTFEISITNYGNVVAENVIISIIVENLTEFVFNDLTSEPILPGTKSITNQTGSGLFEIEVVPPRSKTIVIAEYNIAEDDPMIKTYVRSDETVGYHGTILTTLVYAAYVALLTFVTTILVKRIKWKWQYSTVLSGGIILVSIALALIIYQS